jgi:hypothetical protein
MSYRFLLLLSAAAGGCAMNDNMMNGQMMDGSVGPTIDMTPCAPGTHVTDGGGCDVDIDWKMSAASLMPTRDHHATFAKHTTGGDFLYVLGGTDHYATYLKSDVQRAPINADGTVGTFVAQSPLPTAMAGQGVAVVDNLVIMTGGVTGKEDLTGVTLSNKTLLSTLDANGNLSAWTEGPTFTGGREHMSLLAQDHWVYLIGGLIGTDGTTNVVRTTVGSDGTLSAWQPMTPLPGKLSHQAATIANNAIYVTGGLVGDPSTTGYSVADVLRAPINSDGTLGAWTKIGMLQNPLCVHSSNFMDGAIYVFGGIENDSDFIANVRRATVHDDGTLGPWVDVAPLPTARAHVLETPILNGFVYSVGGSVFDLSCIPEVDVGHYQ